MTNTVSPETGRRLAAAGFPQPQPAPGQWWGDSEGLVFVFGETVPMPGINWIDENGDIHPVVGHTPVVHYVSGGRPIIDDYFDARDFTGLVYLPTATDILRECSALIKLSYHFKLFYATYSGSDDSDTGAFLLSDTNPAEAADIAYLSIHEKSKT